MEVPLIIPEVDSQLRSDLKLLIESMPASRLLGISVRGFAPSGISVLELPVQPSHTHDGSTVQGGIVGTLADYAGVSAASSTLGDGYAVATAAYEVHNLAPARGELLVAVGRLVRAGSTNAVSRADVYCIRQNGSETEADLVCIATTTAAIFRRPPPTSRA